MKKGKKYIQAIMSMIVLLVVSINLCSCQRTYFFEYEGVWYSEEPFIELNCVYYRGKMKIKDATYDLVLSYANDGIDIEMCDRTMRQEIGKDVSGNPIFAITEDMILWEADTVVKDGKLYLTVTKDNISDYEGKTIELKLRPYKEGEDAYPEEE